MGLGLRVEVVGQALVEPDRNQPDDWDGPDLVSSAASVGPIQGTDPFARYERGEAM